ncbi:MAG TPA: tetratricopeptide repeat protein [Verrucomicrobiae bacterium]|jgi:hypothetical protein
MKLLQNPYVVGALALVAAAFVYFNVVAPTLKRNVPAAAPPPAVSVGVPAAATAPKNTETKPADPASASAQRKIEPAASIDLNQVGWAFNGSPRRDPFQVNTRRTLDTNRPPSATELLTLKAIWRQTGSNLAVVFKKSGGGAILGEGESILGFQIDTIGSDSVWMHGQGGREQLGFDPGQEMRANFYRIHDYRVVGGVTNDATIDPSWTTIRGKVIQVLSNGTYLTATEAQALIVKNVPMDLVDDEPLPPVLCKYAGTESYIAVSGAKKTVRAYDYGVPCAPPREAIEKLEAQIESLKQQAAQEIADRSARASQASAQRSLFEMDAAERGRASAQYLLGRRYRDGDGIPKDDTKARFWLEKSAAQGNPDAQAALQLLGNPK